MQTILAYVWIFLNQAIEDILNVAQLGFLQQVQPSFTAFRCHNEAKPH